jgi:hypothetical protein
MWISKLAKVNNTAAMLALLMAATSANANYFCSGTVQNVEVGPNGVITVLAPSAGLNPAYPCQIGNTINGVGPDACKAILSILLAAHAAGGTVTFAYDDALTCATHPAWDWLAGWYYGPEYD